MSNNKNLFNWLKKIINEWTNRNISDSVIKEKIQERIKPCPPVNDQLIGSQAGKNVPFFNSSNLGIGSNATHNLGFFSNIRALKSLYPKAGKGDIATVGNVTYVYDEKWRKL